MLHWLLQVSMYQGWMMGKGNCVHQLLCSWRILPKIPGPPVHALWLVNKSPSYIAQVFFRLLLLCCISLYLFSAIYCGVSLRVRTQFPVFLQLIQSWAYWFLEFWVLGSANYKNLWNLGQSFWLSYFEGSGGLIWGSFYLLSLYWWCLYLMNSPESI